MNTFTNRNSGFGSQFAVAVLIALLLATLAVTGCRTMEGAGKDIERAGEKIQENAKK